MSKTTNTTQSSSGPSDGGCLSGFALVCFWWALLAGLPTPWGVLSLDVFPPGIYLDPPGAVAQVESGR